MTTEPADVPAPHDQAGQYLAVIAASLSASGITSRLSRLAGTPVLTVAAPGGGLDPATVAIHPDPYADPRPQFDCTCTWTPAPGASPEAVATAITAILNAVRPTDPAEDLTARIFRGLYPEFDLHTLAGTYLVVPAGTPCFAAPALGEIARQISGCEHHAPVPPDALHGPSLPRRPEPRR